MRKPVFSGLIALTLLCPGAADAVPVQWTLDGSTFSGIGPGTITGSFVYDADTAAFADMMLASTSGSYFDTFAGTRAAQAWSTATGGLVFLQPGGTGASGETALLLSGVYLTSLTNAGGVLHVGSSGFNWFSEYLCLGACLNAGMSSLGNWNKDVSTLTGVPVTTPEPGTLALLAIGLVGLAVARTGNDFMRSRRIRRPEGCATDSSLDALEAALIGRQQ